MHANKSLIEHDVQLRCLMARSYSSGIGGVEKVGAEVLKQLDVCRETVVERISISVLKFQ